MRAGAEAVAGTGTGTGTGAGWRAAHSLWVIAGGLCLAGLAGCDRGGGDGKSGTPAPSATGGVQATGGAIRGANGSPPPEVTPPESSLAEGLAVARARVLAEPGSAEAWGRYGQTLEAAEFVREARGCYGRAVELDPASARWMHLLGLLELADAPERAVAHLASAVALGGVGVGASRVRLAQALVERGRFAEATPHLEALISGQPGHAAARLELARVRLFEQRLADAATALAPCLTNPYTAKSALLLLGQVRGREGQEEEAARCVRRAAALARPYDWPDPYQREVQSLRTDRARQAEQVNAKLGQRRYAEVDALLSALLERMPDDPELVLLAGRSLLQQGRCGEAEAKIRAHLGLVPNSLNGLTQLSLALLCQQRWGDAVPVLEQAIALKPDFATAYANLGVARSRLGDRSGAIRSHREALRCNPGDAGQHVLLAEELERAGEIPEAWRQTERALEIEPAMARAMALRDRLRPLRKPRVAEVSGP